MLRLLAVGLAMVILGTVLLVAVTLEALGKSNVQVSAIGCVFIFFVPICVGQGPPGLLTWGVVAAAGLYLLAVLLLLLLRRS